MDDEKGQKDDKGPVITFADYERLVMKLEQERNFSEIEAQNPKAMEDHKRLEQE